MGKKRLFWASSMGIAFLFIIFAGCGYRLLTPIQINLTAPTISLIAPVNEATGQAATITLTWEATAGTQTNAGERAATISGYRVYFGKSGEDYPAPQWVTAKELQKNVLERGTTYKWKVIAVQSDGKGVASGQWSFTTLGETYGDPQISLTSPVNGATGQATTITLTWEATPGAQINIGERVVSITGYYVYYRKSGEDYPAPQWVTDKTIQKTNLEYNAVYQWQVVAVQSDGKVATSTDRTFTTAEMYGAPEIALRTPGNLSTGQATSVTLTWEATPGEETTGARANSLTGYDVYFAKASESYGASQRVTAKELHKSLLEYGTTYKWNVVAVQSDGKSAASGERSFTTLGETYGDPQVSLISPINGATDQATTVTLTWEATPGAQTNTGERVASIAGYTVYFGKSGENYPAPQWVTEKALQKTNLEYNATYKWQVVAAQSDGKTATGTERTFTTAEMYGAPEIALKTPTNLSTGQATTVTLTWEATPGVETAGARVNSLTGYDVYFAKASESYGTPQRVTVKELQKSSLEYGTTYKWNVVAVQSDGKSAASGERSFTTLGETYGNPQINLTSPINGATGQATTVTLTWEATPGVEITGAKAASLTGYDVYFAKASESYGAPQRVTVKELQKSALEYRTTYKWNVVAVQSDGKKAASGEWIFTTVGESYADPQINLTAPANGATGQATMVTLTWEATPGARTNAGERAASIAGYTIYFGKAGEDYPAPQWVTDKTIQKTNLEYNVTYQWQVVAVQSDGRTATSTERTFTTAERAITLPEITLLLPTHEATMVSLHPTLSWEATPGAQTNASSRAIAITSYDIYFSKTSEDYPDPENVTGKQLIKQNLESWTEYKWKVVANQSDGQQTTTPEATFLTSYTFLMGNTRNSPEGFAYEKPVHGIVFTYEYEIGSYEVTFDQYEAYLLATGYPTSTVDDWGYGRGTCPVINVSWYDAVRYCNWLSDQVGLPHAYSETTWDLLDASGATTTDITQVKGWRLPTEAEWEYAARGGQADITNGIEANDYLYTGSDTLNEVGWYRDISGDQTHPVGGKAANELGLYDMSGNVYEWCHDRWGDYPSETQTNPTGPGSGDYRVHRGGSFYSEAQYCRVAFRNNSAPNGSIFFLGFRLARTVY
jgi:formylglycine-generating enzyme required for sulfatase activity/L-ribulose-5-phosphate 3-epimerase UlaE